MSVWVSLGELIGLGIFAVSIVGLLVYHLVAFVRRKVKG